MKRLYAILASVLLLTACGGGGSTGSGTPGASNSQINVTGTTQQAVANKEYSANSSSQVVITLPASPAIGDKVKVTGVGVGGWKVTPNAGQTIVTTNIGGVGLTPVKTLVSTIPLTANQTLTGIVSSADGSKLAAPAGGQIYTSSDYGATWTPHGPSISWRSIASSSDGSKLVAPIDNGQIYTSSDYGVTWAPHGPSSLHWQSAASSADGTKLVAVVWGGQIYTSSDSGNTWTPTGPTGSWSTVASSADGTKLVAATGQQIYTSSDSGVTWTPNAPSLNWTTHNGSSNHKTVAMSADGNTIISATADSTGGQVYTSHDFGLTWTTSASIVSPQYFDSIASSSDGSKIVVGEINGKFLMLPDAATGTASTLHTHAAVSADGSKMIIATEDGQIYSVSSSYALVSVYGNQYDSIELQYIGNNIFNIISHEGNLTFN